jgi:peptidoglycan/LPS O-acetylase OafA/YrhL
LPLNHDEYLRTRRFGALDGVRGIAAAAVVMSHFGGASFVWASGWLGVQVFFVLSGFLITTLALREEGRRGRLDLRAFYVRRVFRIWPAYFVVLAAAVGLLCLRNEFTVRGMDLALPWYATFNGDFRPADIMFGQTWTIGIEQKFYVVWPLLAFLPFAMGLGRRLGVLGGVFVVGALLWGSAAGFVVHYLVIALGCAMAVLMHDRRTYRFVVQLARPVVAGCCWLALGLYQLAVPALSAALGGQPLVVLGYGLLVALAMPSLLVLPALTRVVSNRVATWWGERSYSLYLVQYFGALVVMSAVPALSAPRLVTGIAVVLVSAAIADLVYRWVELPGIELGRRFTRPRKPPVDETVGWSTRPPVAPPVAVPSR